MRRRDLLRAVLLALGGASTSVAEELRQSPGQVPERAGPAVAPAGVGSLSVAERETVVAFAEVLVGDRPFSPAARAEMLGYIADRVRASDDMLTLYRETAALLDRFTGAPFSALAFRERLDLVLRYRLGPSRGIVESPEDAGYSARRRVAPDLIAGYYGSPMGWAAVGYEVFPGRCGDLVRYTRPEP